METNVLYYGDNLEILRHRNESGDHDYFPDNSVELIYLDPPFNSQKSYNILFKERDTSWSPAQIKAFEDTWHWSTDTEATYRDLLVNAPTKVAQLLGALIGEPENPGGIGRNDVTAYLVMMTARLIELHRVLKPTGSLYLHCDPTMSHYIKLILDQIFGPANFRNEIVWQRFGSHNDPKRFGRITDSILFYSKTQSYRFKPIRGEYSESHLTKRFNYSDPDGRRFWPNTCLAPGRRGPRYEWNGHIANWRFTREKMEELDAKGEIYYSKTGVPYRKNYLDSLPGQLVQNLWTDIKMTRSGAERLGYETQKPLALLERIIKASSSEGDIVLDPFCGCGTALVAAHKLDRKWIGIDITHLAIAVMKRRLQDHFPGIQIKVVGEPIDLPSAKTLARQNRYQFQWWALSLIGARPLGEKKKGADKGIDGVIPFTDDGGAKLKRVVIQVKSGGVGVKDIRELKTVASNDPIGVLLTLEAPTQPMETEAAEAGFYESPLWQRKFPRIQILTIEAALAGKQPLMPMAAPPPKATPLKTGKQPELL
jgi:site-specific DNA-methyltransferase (adenine-specific)